MSNTQWFVMCNPNDNEYLAAFLAMHSIGNENAYLGMLCADGKERDLWLVPNSVVGKLRDAKHLKRSDPIFRFKFFKRAGNNGGVFPADFLERPTVSRKVTRALEDLGKIKAKRAHTST